MSAPTPTASRIEYWKKFAEPVGLVSAAQRAMDRGDLPYHRFNKWRYLSEDDWQEWLDSHRVVDPASERPAHNPTPPSSSAHR